MEKPIQNDCQCQNNSCGCAGAKIAPCPCGEACACRSACQCGAGCRCGEAK